MLYCNNGYLGILLLRICIQKIKSFKDSKLSLPQPTMVAVRKTLSNKGIPPKNSRCGPGYQQQQKTSGK